MQEGLNQWGRKGSPGPLHGGGVGRETGRRPAGLSKDHTWSSKTKHKQTVNSGVCPDKKRKWKKLSILGILFDGDGEDI